MFQLLLSWDDDRQSSGPVHRKSEIFELGIDYVFERTVLFVCTFDVRYMCASYLVGYYRLVPYFSYSLNRVWGSNKPK